MTATVQRLKNEISRLNQLAGQFRTISRREKYDFQPTGLASLIDDVIKIQTPHFAQLNIEIEQLIPTDLPTVAIDKDKIKQALLNLIKNAAEAMPGGGKINIEACVTENSVSDRHYGYRYWYPARHRCLRALRDHQERGNWHRAGHRSTNRYRPRR